MGESPDGVRRVVRETSHCRDDARPNASDLPSPGYPAANTSARSGLQHRVASRSVGQVGCAQADTGQFGDTHRAAPGSSRSLPSTQTSAMGPAELMGGEANDQALRITGGAAGLAVPRTSGRTEVMRVVWR